MKNKVSFFRKIVSNFLKDQYISISLYKVIIVICLLPILVLSLSFILFYIQDNEKRNNDYFESSRHLSINQLHDLFINYENETRLLSQHFSYESTDKFELTDSYIQSTISNILSSYPEITAVTFQDKNFQQFIETRSSFDRDLYNQYFGLIDPTRREVLVRPLKNYSFFGEQQQLLVISRNLYEPMILQNKYLQEAYIGTIYLFIKPDYIAQIIETNQAHDELDYFLLYNNRVIYSPERTQRYLTFTKERLIDAYTKQPNSIIINTNSPSNYLNRFEIITVSHRTTNRFLSQPKYWFFILICLAFAFFIPLSVYQLINKILIQPIESLVKEILNINNESSFINSNNLPDNEIRFVSTQINLMLNELYDNSRKLRAAEIKQKESELKSLKSQLQPHYLYNTLEVIRMSALVNNDFSVATMVKHLSNQLEYVFRNTDEEFVKVQEEVQNIIDYLELINIRFEGQITYQVDMQEELNHIKIPRLSLQPLVENSIKHGLKEKGNRGLITVNGYLETDIAVIEIFDNGVGMTKKEVLDLKRKMTLPSNHLGLGIVHLRIQDYYGEEYGLDIQSTIDKWTIIRILLPIRKEI